jgi:hypothetical protein
MLKAWAKKRESDGEFPRLIRRLILETTPRLVHLGVPAGDGVSTGGWDGVVETSEGSPWVPEGRSLWELSTEESVGAKADRDYEKRVENPLVDHPGDHEYVAASLRPWRKQDEWAKQKAQDGVWKDMRAYGADKIETWLESAPATWAWFSELNGLTPYGVRTVSAWWEAWSIQTNPTFSPDVVLAGREENVRGLVDRLSTGNGFATTIGGPSQQDVCAFIAATAVALDRAGSGDMLARTVFVDDVNAWRRLLDGRAPLVLVPLLPELAAEVPPNSPHQVVVPVDRPDTADEQLAPLDATLVRDALAALGVDDEGEAENYGRLARRSLTALRRRLGELALSNPAWSEHPVGRVARACLLAGAWVDSKEGDRAALAELGGVEYEEFVEDALVLGGRFDPMISRFDGAWHLIDPLDAWTQMRSAVAPQDLERLTGVMSTVLGEVDPALELPQDERWWRAAFDGKQRTCSHQLRRGLANTLALLGEFGETVETSGGGTAADLAAGVVRRLLTDANADATGQRWASLSDLLPLLAEGSPDAFLDGVQDGLSGDELLLATIFTDEGDPLFGSGSPHTGLLWALETVAWSAVHLGQVTELLARLAEVDPGGRMSNRPANSLVSIFRPWHPDNTATDESRLRVIDAIRRRHPDVSWPWLVAMLPEAHGTHFPTRSPEYRDWKPSKTSVTVSAYWAFISELIDRCIDDAAGSTARWLELIDKLDDVPADERAKILVRLQAEAVDGAAMEEVERTQLWDGLRALAGRHRTYADANWALPEDQLTPIDELAEELAPTRARVANRWLFDEYHPDLDDVKWTDDHEGFEAALRQRRVSAVEAVLDEEGLDGVRLLAASLHRQQPWSVGVALADAQPNFDDDLLAALTDEEAVEQRLSEAYFTRRFANHGWDWLDGLLARAEPTSQQRAQLLLASRDFPIAWDRADELGDDVASGFWQNFRQYGLGGDFEHAQYAARRMMDVGRYAQALDLINLYARKDDDGRSVLAQLAADGLEALLRMQAGQDEMSVLDAHGFDSLFELLESQRDSVGVERVANLEWAYLPALDHEPTIPSLTSSLADSPDLFVQIISAVYRPHRDADDPEDDGGASIGEMQTDPAHAQNGYRLLSNWNHPPGFGADGLDEQRMNQWVDDAMAKLVEARRLDAGSVHIGHVLTHVPPDEDGVIPSAAVRDTIERLASRKIEEGFITQTLNSRGVTSRGLEDGGLQEEALVEKYREHAGVVADEHPRSAAILRHLAESYEREARRNEASAERVRRGLR